MEGSQEAVVQECYSCHYLNKLLSLAFTVLLPLECNGFPVGIAHYKYYYVRHNLTNHFNSIFMWYSYELPHGHGKGKVSPQCTTSVSLIGEDSSLSNSVEPHMRSIPLLFSRHLATPTKNHKSLWRLNCHYCKTTGMLNFGACSSLAWSTTDFLKTRYLVAQICHQAAMLTKLALLIGLYLTPTTLQHPLCPAFILLYITTICDTSHAE